MQGIALNDIATMGEVNRALEGAGFQIIEAADRAVHENSATTPWYQPMETRGGTPGNALRRIPLGRAALMGLSRLAEALRVFPKGSAGVIGLLDRTAHAYVAGGRAGIFTPLYCFVALKPPASGRPDGMLEGAPVARMRLAWVRRVRRCPGCAVRATPDEHAARGHAEPVVRPAARSAVSRRSSTPRDGVLAAPGRQVRKARASLDACIVS